MADLADLEIAIRSNAKQASDELDKLTASSAKAEKSASSLSNSTKMAKSSVDGLGKSAASAASGLSGKLDPAIVKTANSTKLAAASTNNLLFQFQDISMMLASGQSPFMLAMQQGTQVSGIFHQLKTSGASIGPAILGAFRSLISPMSLFTVGAIAATAAIGQWAIKAISAKDDAENLADSLDRLRDASSDLDAAYENSQKRVADLAEEYGNYAVVLENVYQSQLRMETRETIEGFKAASNEIANLFGSLEGSTEIYMPQKYGGSQIIDHFEASTRELEKALGLSADEADRLGQMLKDIGKASSIDEQVAKVAELQSYLSANEDAIDTSTDSAKLFISAVNDAAEDAAALSRLGYGNEEIQESIKSGRILSGLFDAILAKASEVSTRTSSLGPSVAGGRGNILPPSSFDDMSIRDMSPRMQLAYQERQAARKRAEEIAKIEAQVAASAASSRSSSGAASSAARERDKFQADLDRLTSSLMTREEVMREAYDREKALLNDNRALEIMGAEDHAQALLSVEERYQKAREQLKMAERDTQLNTTKDIFEGMNDLLQTFGKKGMRIAKAFSVGRAIINTYQGVTKALAEYAPPWSFIQAGAVLAKGMAAVRAIKGVSDTGGGGASTSSGGGGGGTSQFGSQQNGQSFNIDINLENVPDMISGDGFRRIISGIQEHINSGVNFNIGQAT